MKGDPLIAGLNIWLLEQMLIPGFNLAIPLFISNKSLLCFLSIRQKLPVSLITCFDWPDGMCDETLLLLMANVLMFGAHPFLRLSCSLLKLERVLRSKIWCAKLKTLKYIPYPMPNHSYHSVLARANKDILPPSAKGGFL